MTINSHFPKFVLCLFVAKIAPKIHCTYRALLVREDGILNHIFLDINLTLLHYLALSQSLKYCCDRADLFCIDWSSVSCVDHQRLVCILVYFPRTIRPLLSSSTNACRIMNGLQQPARNSWEGVAREAGAHLGHHRSCTSGISSIDAHVCHSPAIVVSFSNRFTLPYNGRYSGVS